MKLGGHIQLIGHFGGGQHNNLIDFPWFAKKKVRSFETGGGVILRHCVVLVVVPALISSQVCFYYSLSPSVVVAFPEGTA